jgi:hypothetical protein
LRLPAIVLGQRDIGIPGGKPEPGRVSAFRKVEGPMKVWIRILTGFGYVWLVLACAAVILGMVGTWMSGGFSAVQDLFSPLNVWFIAVVTLAPGAVALALAKNLTAKQAKARRPPMT